MKSTPHARSSSVGSRAAAPRAAQTEARSGRGVNSGQNHAPYKSHPWRMESVLQAPTQYVSLAIYQGEANDATTTPRSNARGPSRVPRYSISEAAFYVRIPATTLVAWTRGQDYRTSRGVHRTFEPLIELADPENKLLSFYNLVEAHMLRSTTERGVPLKNVRKALDYIREAFPRQSSTIGARFRGIRQRRFHSTPRRYRQRHSLWAARDAKDFGPAS